MVFPGSDPPATASRPQTSRNLTMGLRLSGGGGGFFLAAGFKKGP